MSTLIVLVGPKGSGKSTLARMIASALSAHVVAIEPIAKRVLVEGGGKPDASYAQRAHEAVVAHLADLAPTHPLLVIETTGAASGMEGFVAALRAQHTVRLVRVEATAEVCDSRVPNAGPSLAGLHRELYLRSTCLVLPWDIVLDNNRPLTVEEVAAALRPLC